MNKINAAITAMGAYVPDEVLTNDDLTRIVDTSDEWITSRVGIKERRIMKDKTLGSSYLGTMAVKNLFERHPSVKPEEIDAIIVSTNTADYPIPNISTKIAYETGCTNAMAFDIEAACPGFLYVLETGAMYIMSGRYKKVLVMCAEMMSGITDYTDRTTCPLFGDAGAVALLEPCSPEYGLQDSILRCDGRGQMHLMTKAGGVVNPASEETVRRREHFVFQDGQNVFKAAVASMCDTTLELMEKNGLSSEDVAWVVPHQANLRIIDAVARRMGIPKEEVSDKVMINIQKYGNTSSSSIPLCLSEWENQLHKGDKIILTAFGAGYTWGSSYLVWAYDKD